MPEIHSTPFTETAKDKIMALLTALAASMITDSIDPLFSYVYDKHNIAELRMNAVSVELIGVEPTDNIVNDICVRYLMFFEVHVHTDYEDGINDANKNRRLLNSILNKFKENINLQDEYRVNTVDQLNPKEEFDGSATVGGSLIVSVAFSVPFEQE